ncbi:MAG TPA: DUF2085 domain-containing protein [Pyrinomonadaceae bacterium]|nr:DUF2085 domain-containing protein [Pyrinomonadaceae bacterium]
MPLPATSYVPQTATPEGWRRRAVLAWLIASGVAAAGVGLIFLAPLLAAGGHGWAAGVVYRAFTGLCHQQAGRSFSIDGHALAVCARCTGIYAGFAACSVLYPLARGLRRTDAPARRWLLLALLPTAVDFALDFSGLLANTHASRALTGAIAGAGAAFFALPGLVELGQSLGRRDRQASLAGGPDAGELSV